MRHKAQGSGHIFIVQGIFLFQFGNNLPEHIKLFAHGHRLKHVFLELADTDIAHIAHGRQTHSINSLSCSTFNGTQHATLTMRSKQNRRSLTTGTASTTNAMHVRLGIVRDIVVNHVTHALNVQAASRHIRGNQNIQRLLLETVNHLFTQRLTHIAIEGSGSKTTGFELFSQLYGGGFGADKDDHGIKRLDLQNARQGINLVKAADHTYFLRDGINRGRFGANLHRSRVFQVSVGDFTNLVRHGGGEQGNLTLFRRLLHDPLDVIDKAHTQHFIGFIKDNGFQVIQPQTFTTQVVHNASRSTNNYVGTTLQTA